MSKNLNENDPNKNIVLLDGAMGSMLIERGMPAGVCPETWGIENSNILKDIYREYILAGSQSILTNTFGGNRVKLRKYSAKNQVAEINKKLAQIARDSAPKSVQVGGNIGPTGQMLEPVGDLEFDEAVDIYAEQAAALAEGGVDYLAIETMIDLQEARTAVLGCKQATSLPIHVSMSFQNGRTLMGDSPQSCAVVLQALGADAVGCNCGSEPVELSKVVDEMFPCLNVPLIAKPNNGKPALRSGKMKYEMKPAEFAAATIKLAAAGARRIGGCCGTTPLHISSLRRQLESMRFMPRKIETHPMIASTRNVVAVDSDISLGNIRADSHITFFDSLKSGDYEAVFDVADKMSDVEVFCLCAVADDLDENMVLPAMARALSSYAPQPLAFRSASPIALESTLRQYPGRAMVILDLASDSNRSKMIQIAMRYGAVAVL